MKIITLALAALLSTGAPAVDNDQPETMQEQQIVHVSQTGKSTVAEIRLKYEQGQYDDFLKEMDTSYRHVQETGQLAPLAEMRGEPIEDTEWLTKTYMLTQERNRDLLAAVNGQEGLFAEQVRSIASQPASEEEATALANLSKLHLMAPGKGKNSDENALIALDLEYEYKAIHLDMPVIGGKVDPAALEKQIVLRMEKMDKMRTIAQGMQDEEWKKTVSLAGNTLDTRLSAMVDRAEIDSLLKGQEKPADAVQEKVVTIFQVHQDKMDEIVANVVPS